jgi:hypothetical protein
MSPSMTVAERLARIETAHANAVEHGSLQRRDMVDRMDRAHEQMSHQIAELKEALREQASDTRAAIKAATDAAAAANAAISAFRNKIEGARMLTIGAIALAGGAGALMSKLAAFLWAPGH